MWKPAAIAVAVALVKLAVHVPWLEQRAREPREPGHERLLALQREEPRRWLAVGAVAGIGLLTKHTMLLWGAGIAVGIALTPSARPQLRTRWPYLGC